MSQTDHFDEVAARYDSLRAPGDVTPVHELLVREGDLAGKRVLDIGCGSGFHTAIFRDRFGCDVAGIDPSSGMLAQARAKLPGADIRQGVAEDMPFADDSFDAALMALVVHHVDRPRAFAEAGRVLVPRGHLLITTTNPDAFPRFWMAPLFPSYVEVEQARFPSFATIDSDLRAAGFTSTRRIDHTVHRAFSRERALERLRGRHASTFDLLDPHEYEEGVARAERELPETVEYDLELMIVIATR
jgi:SAM-dependent methyltransferase